MTIAGEIAIEYLEKYPALPLRSLASLMYNERPELFKSMEAARWKLRYYTGKSGEINKKKLSNTEHKHLVREAPGKLNPFVIPESDADTWEPYHLPKAATRILVMSDIHLPYHDVEALKLTIQYGKEHK